MGLFQHQGGGGGGVWEHRGGATVLIGGWHADLRVAVGLQVHGGDVTCFTIVSVKGKKDRI